MSSVAKNSLYNGLGYIAGSISIFFAFVYFSRVLGPELLGVFQIEYALVMSCILFFLSFADYALAYHLGSATTHKEKQIFFTTSTLLTIGVSIAIIAVLWLMHDTVLFYLLNIDPIYKQEATMLLVYFLIYLFLQGIINNVKALYIASNQFNKRFTLMLLHAVSTSGGSVLAYAFIGSLSSISLGMLIGALIPFSFVLRTIVSSRLLSVKGIARAHIISYTSYGWWTLAINASHQVHRWFDSFVLSAMLGTTAVGIYAAAYNIFSELVRIPKIIGEALFPKLLSKHSMSQVLGSIIQMVSIFQIAVGALLFLFSPLLIEIIYGPEYSGSTTVLMILSISILISPYWITNMALLALNAPKRMAIAIIMATICNVLLNIPLIGALEIVGAAIATTISYIIYYAISTHQLHTMAVHVQNSFSALSLLVSGSVSAIIAYYLGYFFSANIIIHSILSGLLFAFFYGIILVFLIKKNVINNPINVLKNHL